MSAASSTNRAHTCRIGHHQAIKPRCGGRMGPGTSLIGVAGWANPCSALSAQLHVLSCRQLRQEEIPLHDFSAKFSLGSVNQSPIKQYILLGCLPHSHPAPTLLEHSPRTPYVPTGTTGNSSRAASPHLLDTLWLLRALTQPKLPTARATSSPTLLYETDLDLQGRKPFCHPTGISPRTRAPSSHYSSV